MGRGWGGRGREGRWENKKEMRGDYFAMFCFEIHLNPPFVVLVLVCLFVWVVVVFLFCFILIIMFAKGS